MLCRGVTYIIVQQMEPVVEVVRQSEGIGDVVAFWTEEQQHSQREVLFATVQHTWSHKHK